MGFDITSLLGGGSGPKGLISSLAGTAGPLGALMGGPAGMLLGGLGSIFGNNKSMEYFDEGISNIQNLPGMQGPANLGGAFGSSVDGQFNFNPAMQGAQNSIQQSMGGLLGGGNQYQNLDVMGQYNNAINQLGQQMGPMNQLSQGGAGQLFGMGMQNMGNAANQSGLYNQQLDIMRQAYAPEANRQTQGMMDELFSKGLLGPGTATGSQNNIIRNVLEQQNQADLGFQNQAFDRASTQQQLMGNLGMQQAGQGLGAENQAFMQALQSLGQNQQAGMSRLGAAQGLFGMGQDAFAQNYGLGLQGAESLLGYGDFGLRGAAMPYQLQASLLQGGGMHAQALGGLAQAQADASAGFMGGLFG